MSSQNENNKSDLQSFSYFISQKGSILVASIAGLCEEEALQLLQECKSEVEQRLGDIQGVVLNLSGLTGIAHELVPVWAQLQSMIRSRNIELRLCGIDNSLKDKLHKMGVLRLTETVSTLQEALPEIVSFIRKSYPSRVTPSSGKKAA